MKKILSFIDWYWPGYKAGGTIRAFMNQVEYMKNDFEFFIVTRDTDYTETIPYQGIKSNQWNEISHHVSVYYVSAKNHQLATFSRIIREFPYDVLYIHGMFSFWYSILPLFPAKFHHHRRIIVAAHGMLGSGALHVKSFKKSLFLKSLGILQLYNGVVFHSATEHESADILTHIGSHTSIFLARELPRKVSGQPTRQDKKAGRLTMVTVARISPEKNQLFALEILSQCRNHEIQYDIIGPVYDEAYWKKCQTLIAALPANIHVTYRGSINSEKVPAELQGYDMMLLPTTGENFGHTILESFMAGCPVIISDRTPWRNLEESGIGRDIPLGNSDAFRKAIEQFAGLDNEKFREYSINAFTFANTYIANPEMLAENINLFNC